MLGFSVDQDQQCPIAIRQRHASSISTAISRCIDKFGGLASPELEHSNPPQHLERITSTSDRKDLGDSQQHGDIWSQTELRSDTIYKPELPPILQEQLKPRPRPRYHKFYPISLPEIEDEDNSTVLNHESQEPDAVVNMDDEDLDSPSDISDGSLDRLESSFDRLDHCGLDGGHSNDGEKHRREAESFGVVCESKPVGVKILADKSDLGSEPRPSDEVIARMTMDQRLQVCPTSFYVFSER